MRLVLTIVAVIAIAALAVAGFALALPTYNTPAQYRLALAGNKTNDCVVRVVGSATNEFLVAQNGEVTIDVPRPLAPAVGCGLVSPSAMARQSASKP